MEKTAEVYSGLKKAWRFGFLILTLAILCLFVSQIILFELTLQAFLLSNWWFSVNVQFFGVIFTVIITMLIGPWFSMIVIFGSTHPKYGTQYWQWLSQGLTVMLFIAMCWAQLVLLINDVTWPYPPSPTVFISLAAALMIYGIVGFFIAALSVLIWVKWLKPEKTE
ncbi:MAG: hypothetical protein ACFFBR_06595 [Promethearchaeota archaeon]